jgi:alanine dehydrogenase
MARVFACAFATVRKIVRIKVYSPNPEHARLYCREMGEKLGIETMPANNPQDAVTGADIVASCTNSIEPTLDARWLEPGIYLANVSNREFSEEVLRRITLVGYLVFEKEPLTLSGFSDDNFELRAGVMAYVSGQAFEREKIPRGIANGFTIPNARWIACVDWTTETQVGRQSDQDIAVLAELASTFPTGLASSSIQGIQFASVAGRAYELASARGLGKTLDLKLFLQDIPT